MNAKFALGAALALLSLTSAAFGQTPAILGPAPGPRAPLSMQEPRIPSGTPGFYDPSTRTFAPLVNESPAAALPTVSGTVVMHVTYFFSPDVHADDTVHCFLNVMFQTIDPTQKITFTDHSESTVVSFGAGSPDEVISRDFSYTPNRQADHMIIELDCFVRVGDSAETFHDFEIIPFFSYLCGMDV